MVNYVTLPKGCMLRRMIWKICRAKFLKFITLSLFSRWKILIILIYSDTNTRPLILSRYLSRLISGGPVSLVIG